MKVLSSLLLALPCSGFSVSTNGIVDYIIILVAKVDVHGNPNEVRDTRYVSPQELKEMFEQPGTFASSQFSDS